MACPSHRPSPFKPRTMVLDSHCIHHTALPHGDCTGATRRIHDCPCCHVAAESKPDARQVWKLQGEQESKPLAFLVNEGCILLPLTHTRQV